MTLNVFPHGGCSSGTKFVDDGEIIPFDIGSDRCKIVIGTDATVFVYSMFIKDEPVADMVSKSMEYKGAYSCTCWGQCVCINLLRCFVSMMIMLHHLYKLPDVMQGDDVDAVTYPSADVVMSLHHVLQMCLSS